MTEPGRPPSIDCLTALVSDGVYEEATASLKRLEAADANERKRTLQGLRSPAEDSPAAFGELCAPLAAFLEDDDRAVRLTTAKLFVTLARSAPESVLSVIEPLAGRVADDGEFYFVRARSAEALGYIALEYPEAVSTPEVLADFRVGLSFDEPEVKEKLAKALEYVALGDPTRLRHHVSSLTDHLDDEGELVRYHLCTALVVVGCDHPEKLSEAEGALRDRLHDESPYVRGRAVEALCLLAQSDRDIEPRTDVGDTDSGNGAPPAFLADRVRFARELVADDERSPANPDGLGTVESVRRGTDDVAEEIRSPDGDRACPQCGLDLPAGGPPMCPRCGVPR